jgi:hypothetical protein
MVALTLHRTEMLLQLLCFRRQLVVSSSIGWKKLNRVA